MVEFPLKDFEGQKLATRVMITGMLGSCLVAIIAGSCTGSFELMIKIVTGAALLVGLVSSSAFSNPNIY